MKVDVTPPIIIDDHGDIGLYANLEDAAADLEAVDVLDEAYEVFDSTGRIIRATAEGINSKVTLTIDTSRPPVPDLLAERLRLFIENVGPERIGIQGSLAALSLKDLVGALARFWGSPSSMIGA